MKSVRTLLFQAIFALALLAALHQPVRADAPAAPAAPIQADSPYASAAATSDAPPADAPETTQPTTATPTFTMPDLSVTALADDFEIAIMYSLPLAAFALLLVGFWQLFFGKGKPRRVIQKDLPVVIPPRRIPQPTY